jgi:hypothetical protein
MNIFLSEGLPIDSRILVLSFAYTVRVFMTLEELMLVSIYMPPFIFSKLLILRS